MRMGLTLTMIGVLMVGSTFMVWGLSLPFGGSSDTLAIALRQIQEMQDLTVLRVPVHFIHESNLHGRMGGIRCLLDTHGSYDLGVDLSRVEFTDIDPQRRTVTLQLPSARVVSRRIDMEATRVLRVDRFGLWWVALGEAGARQVVQKALRESEQLVQKASLKLSHHEQASQRAKAICGEVATKLGWRVQNTPCHHLRDAQIDLKEYP